MPLRSRRPCVGRMPYSPQKLAGTRTEPPVSVPSAVSQRPAATAAAEPEDEPPGTWPGARGLTGVPSNGFSPRMPSETSSVTVLPIRVAPASSRVCTAQACRSGTGFARAQSGLPPPVGRPATSNRSLAAKVSPASGPPARPAMRNRCPETKAPIGSDLSSITTELVIGTPVEPWKITLSALQGGEGGAHAASGGGLGWGLCRSGGRAIALAAQEFADRLGGDRVR